MRLARSTVGGRDAVNGIEGQAGPNQISVSKLDTPDPHVKVTAADGKVIYDGPLSGAGKQVAPTAPTPAPAQAPAPARAAAPVAPSPVASTVAPAVKSGVPAWTF